MDEWGVCKAIFHNIATKPNQEETINNFALSVNNPRLIPFAALHHQSDDLPEKIKVIKEQGFIGIKLHPDYAGFMVDDKDLYPLYDLCAQFGIVIMFHAGVDFISPNLVHATPQNCLKVHHDFPNLMMILAHLGGYSMWDDVLELIAGKNVYMDTSMCAGAIEPTLMKQILSKHDPERILFGSDCPWQTSKESFEFLQTIGLSDNQLDKIAYQNAQKLLAISSH